MGPWQGRPAPHLQAPSRAAAAAACSTRRGPLPPLRPPPRQVFKIPPRGGAGGWRSGEWRLGDKIFSGRCRVVATGAALEVRLEDPAT